MTMHEWEIDTVFQRVVDRLSRLGYASTAELPAQVTDGVDVVPHDLPAQRLARSAAARRAVRCIGVLDASALKHTPPIQMAAMHGRPFFKHSLEGRDVPMSC